MRAQLTRVATQVHTCLVHPEFAPRAGDTPPGVPSQGVHGVMLPLPLAETFRADSFGMVVDHFGVPWAVNGGPRA